MVDLAYRIYRKIFTPIEYQAGDIAHLITVPSSALLSLPFGLLVTDSANAAYPDYTGVPWLLKRSAISLVPSVRAFIDLRAVAGPLISTLDENRP